MRLLPVANRFFGGNIGVTGLLTGADLAARLASEPEGDRYLLPDVVLSQGRFLDGMSLAELPRVVETVPTDGASLVRALAARRCRHGRVMTESATRARARASARRCRSSPSSVGPTSASRRS